MRGFSGFRVAILCDPMAVDVWVRVCACTPHERTRTAADSRMLAQRIPLDGTSTQILPFERAQISDKSRTSRYSRNGLLGYIKALGMSSVLSLDRSPGNTRLVLHGETERRVTLWKWVFDRSLRRNDHVARPPVPLFPLTSGGLVRNEGPGRAAPIRAI